MSATTPEHRLKSVFLFAMLLPVAAVAQITFERYYGGEQRDEAAVARPIPGGYVVAALTRSFGADSGEVWVIWTNTHGETLKTRRYGVPGMAMRVSDIQPAIGGGYWLGGDARILGQSDDSRDVWVARLDGDGETLHTRMYGGSLNDANPVFIPTADSGCFALASYQKGLNSDKDFWLMRLDASGDTVWVRQYGWDGTDEPKCMAAATDGGLVLAGYTRAAGQPMGDVWLLKTNAAGDTQWTRKYGAPDAFEQGMGVTPTEDGGYLIHGVRSTTSAIDWYTVKTDATGDTLWAKVWGGAQYDWGGAAIQVPGGGYVLAGFVNSNYVSTGDLCLFAVSTAGDSTWCRTYGGAGMEVGWAAVRADDGGYVVAGMTSTYGVGIDAYLVKTDANGVIGIQEPPRTVVREPVLRCEPNPFRTGTAISLQLTADSPEKIGIYDASGRCVRVLAVSREPSAVSFWDGSSSDGRPAPSGVYVVRCGGSVAQVVRY